MALDKFRAPGTLPNPPLEWDPQYMRQVLRSIELYFGQLDSRTPNNAEQYSADRFIGGTFSGDGRSVYVPFNEFSSTATQSAAAVDQAYAMTMNVDGYPGDISVVSNSQITFVHPGVYNVSYSVQLKNTTNDLQTVDIWLRYKGVDIATTNTRFAIQPRKSVTEPSYLVAVTPLMVSIPMAADYIQVMYRVSNTAVTIEYLPAVTYSAGVTPAIPATPSVIVSVQFVSAI